MANTIIRVIETTSFQREDFMPHGLHLNLRGTKELELFIVKGSDDKNMSGRSRIPVTTSARVFFI